ncbi:phosphatidylinositol 4-kinase type II subunit alpha [Anopheles sinensis]|uniref:Phosphatidylinositol 4-kinase type II subunit alpha n=1 Tax=Anopheles sinensis TaxID=74873 RepID=A0A084VVS4_ANOSI|nr:phosphatidylinositol 4-kinase type II subunit alpha [Anopheles sinensis]
MNPALSPPSHPRQGSEKDDSHGWSAIGSLRARARTTKSETLRKHKKQQQQKMKKTGHIKRYTDRSWKGWMKQEGKGTGAAEANSLADAGSFEPEEASRPVDFSVSVSLTVQ